MKKLFTLFLLLATSLSASALTITEDKVSRPLTLKFEKDEISVNYGFYIFKQKGEASRSIEAMFDNNGITLFYYNSNGDFIFDEVVSGNTLKRIFRKANLDENCPITFKILPEEKKFDNIHLGCDSYASIEEDRTFI